MSTRIVFSYINTLNTPTFWPLIFILTDNKFNSKKIFYKYTINTMSVNNTDTFEFYFLCTSLNTHSIPTRNQGHMRRKIKHLAKVWFP